MRRYAIDVVILPPTPIMDLAIAWNKRLSEIKDQSIVLDRALTLPHISLLMGCVSEDGLKEAIGAARAFYQPAVSDGPGD